METLYIDIDYAELAFRQVDPQAALDDKVLQNGFDRLAAKVARRFTGSVRTAIYGANYSGLLAFRHLAARPAFQLEYVFDRAAALPQLAHVPHVNLERREAAGPIAVDLVLVALAPRHYPAVTRLLARHCTAPLICFLYQQSKTAPARAPAVVPPSPYSLQGHGRFLKGREELQPQLEEIKQVLAKLRQTVPRRSMAATIRGFVHTNSLHRNDAQARRYAGNTPLVLQKLLNTHWQQGDPPHLACGPRANAMVALCDLMDVKARVIHLFSSAFDDIRGHILVEVFDAKARQWQVQDPDCDTAYYCRGADRPVSGLQVLVTDLENIQPCGPLKTGWRATGTQHLKAHFWGALLHYGHAANALHINHQRFDVRKRFAPNNGERFYTYIERNYDPVVII